MTYEVRQIGIRWQVVSLWCGVEHDVFGTYGDRGQAETICRALNENAAN